MDKGTLWRVAPKLPLSVLLSQTLIALTAEFEAEGAGTFPIPTLAMWSNVLQYVDKKGVDQRQLPELARLSKRAIRTAVGVLERSGYVFVEAGPADEAKMVRLTPRGLKAREAWKPLFGIVEKRWKKRFGREEIDKLRGSLESLVSQLEYELSHYPTSYGPADLTITGGPGEDWKFFHREGGGSVSTLPLSALLSQTLVAFSIDYEREASVALAHSANVLRFLRATPQRIKDLPAMPVGSLRWHGFVVLDKDPTDGRTKRIRLASPGRRAREAYLPLVKNIERNWQKRYGEATLRTLRASLESLVGQLDSGLPHHPPMNLTP